MPTEFLGRLPLAAQVAAKILGRQAETIGARTFVAFVTGGARGLGQASAVELARRGARVAIADRKAEAAEETARLCNEHTPGAQAFVYDQADAASVESCVNAVVEACGRIDALFANAGTGKFAPIVDMKKSDWDFLIQVNLNGAFYVCQDVARQMIRQGRGGKIVLTASSGSTVMCDQLGAYCASKAGVLMLMKPLRRNAHCVEQDP